MVTRRSPKVVTAYKPLLQSCTVRNDCVEQPKARHVPSALFQGVSGFYLCFVRVSGSLPRDASGGLCVWPDALHAHAAWTALEPSWLAWP